MQTLKNIIFINLLFLSLSLKAHETWLKKGERLANIRQFLTIEKTENDLVEVNFYQQKKGDYQDLIKHQFVHKKDLASLVQSYEKTSDIPVWNIEEGNDIGPNNAIWEVKNSWSEYWENKYAEWLRREVDPEFFSRHKIAIDCADVGIGFRWIFARINALPVANTQAGSGNLVGHFSMKREWMGLPRANEWYNDQVFLAALDYAMTTTSTWSIIFYDGLPVRIDSTGLKAGTFIVYYQNNSGHLRTIVENYFNRPNELPIYTYASTSPRELRNLYREPFIDQIWPLYRQREIMAFRWPVQDRYGRWSLMPREQDYRYSYEQFDTSLSGRYSSLIQFILERTNPKYNPQNLIRTSISDLKGYLEIRKKIVNDGYNYCVTNGCSEGSKAYDDWSTPSRDRQVLLKYTEMQNLLQAFETISPGIVQAWRDQLDNEVIQVEGRYLSLSYVRILFERGLTSSDPNQPILRRWGLD